MALIKSKKDNQLIELRANHLVGRLDTHDEVDLSKLSINEPYISRQHASFRWNGNEWLINDNNSRNGTFINGNKISYWTLLKKGNVIEFTKSHCWIVMDVSKPVSKLIPVNQNCDEIKLDGMIKLGNFSNLDHYIFQDDLDGWILSNSLNERKILDNERLTLSEYYSWIVKIEKDSNLTLPSENTIIPKFYLNFNVSSDEEHIHLNAIIDGIEINLGERVTHYILILLVRQRNFDTENNFNEEDRGWVSIDELQCLTGLDYSHINLYLWRAKKQFDEKVLKNTNFNSLSLFQRRIGSIRINTDESSINKSGKLEHVI